MIIGEVLQAVLSEASLSHNSSPSRGKLGGSLQRRWRAGRDNVAALVGGEKEQRYKRFNSLILVHHAPGRLCAETARLRTKVPAESFVLD